MSDKAHYVGDYHSPIASLNSAHGIVSAALLWRPRPASITDPAGLWVEGSRVRGSRVHAISVSGVTTAARSFNLLRGQLVTKAGAGLSIGSDSTILRTSGSFIADGYQPGQRVVPLDTDLAAEDGGLSTQILNRRVATITGVAAGTLTFAANTFVTGQAALAATVGLYRVAGLVGAVPVDINAGNAAQKYAVAALVPGLMPSVAAKPDSCLVLGARGVLLATVAAAALAAGETLDFAVEAGDY